MMKQDSAANTTIPNRRSLVKLQLLGFGVLLAVSVALRLWTVRRVILLLSGGLGVALVLVFCSIWLLLISRTGLDGFAMLLNDRYTGMGDAPKYSPPICWDTFFSHYCYGEEKDSVLCLSNPEIQECLNKLIERIRVVYIESWYTALTKDTRFAYMAEHRLRGILSKVIDILSKQDIDTLMFSKIIPLITAHFVDYKVAEKSYESSVKSSTKPQLPKLLLISRFYPENRFHPALKLTEAKSLYGDVYSPAVDTDEQEVCYLRKLSGKLLKAFLSKSDSECDTLFVILVEILSQSILKLIVDTVSDPHFFYSNLEIILDSINKRDDSSFAYNTLSKYLRLERISGSMMGGIMDGHENSECIARTKIPSDERLLSFVYIMGRIESSKNIFDIFFVHEEILLELKKVACAVLPASKKTHLEGLDSKTESVPDASTLIRCLSIAHKKAMKKTYVFNNKTRQHLPSFLKYRQVRDDFKARVMQILMNRTPYNHSETGIMKLCIEFLREVCDLRALLSVMDNMFNSVYVSNRCSINLSGFTLSRYYPDVSMISSYYHIISSMMYDFLVLRSDTYNIPLFIYTECLLVSYFCLPIDENISRRMEPMIKTSRRLYDKYLSPASGLYTSLHHTLQYSISVIAPQILPDSNNLPNTDFISGVKLIIFILVIERQIISYLERNQPNLFSKNEPCNNQYGYVQSNAVSQVRDYTDKRTEESGFNTSTATPDLNTNNSPITNLVSSQHVQPITPESLGAKNKDGISISGLLSMGRKKLSTVKSKHHAPKLRKLFTVPLANITANEFGLRLGPTNDGLSDTPETYRRGSLDCDGVYLIDKYHMDNANGPPYSEPPHASEDPLRLNLQRRESMTSPIQKPQPPYGTRSYSNADMDQELTHPNMCSLNEPLNLSSKYDGSNLSQILSSTLSGDECVVAISDNLKMMDAYMNSIEEEDISICQCIRKLQHDQEARKLYIELLNEQSLINARLIKIKRTRRLLLARELSEAISPSRISVCIDEVNSSHPVKNYERITYSAMVTCFSLGNSMFSWRLYFTYQGVQNMLRSIEHDLKDAKTTLPPLKRPYLPLFKGRRSSPRRVVMQLSDFFDYMCSSETMCNSNLFRRFICSPEAFSILQELSNEEQDCNGIINCISKLFDSQCAPQTTIRRINMMKTNSSNPYRMREADISLASPASYATPSGGHSLIQDIEPHDTLECVGDMNTPSPSNKMRENSLSDILLMHHSDKDQAISDLDDFADATDIPVHTSTTAILNLFLEIFSLRSRRNWIRRQVLAFILPQIIGSLFKKRSTLFIKSFITDNLIIRCINYVISIVDSTTSDCPPQEISVEQRMKTLLHTKRYLIQLMSRNFAPILGEGNTIAASHLIWNIFQDRRLNANMIYLLLDEISEVFINGGTKVCEQDSFSDKSRESDLVNEDIYMR